MRVLVVFHSFFFFRFVYGKRMEAVWSTSVASKPKQAWCVQLCVRGNVLTELASTQVNTDNTVLSCIFRIRLLEETTYK